MGDVSVRSLPLWMNFAVSPMLRCNLAGVVGKPWESHTLALLRFSFAIRNREGRCAIESITFGLYTGDERFTDARIHGGVGE